MKKSIAVTTGTFLLLAGFVVNAQAARTNCTVSAVKDSAVILDCGDKTSTLKVGSTVSLKTKVQRKKVIEGC
jgi:hypothetical protein